MIRFGGWLFRHRTIIPVPLALLILLLPGSSRTAATQLVIAGAAMAVAGEAIRLWGVRHIGTISRTRSDRLGPLVAAGPFAYVRNPLYVGNMLLWTGLALAGRLVWLAPVVIALLAIEYHAIVLWEEQLLAERLGSAYREYAAIVPRWLPRIANRQDRKGAAPLPPSNAVASAFSWRDTLFSERGTLIAIACGFLLLWLKDHV
jgi:protein-S-isoprenylcysteine O-methyltransferase Ste14